MISIMDRSYRINEQLIRGWDIPGMTKEDVESMEGLDYVIWTYGHNYSHFGERRFMEIMNDIKIMLGR